MRLHDKRLLVRVVVVFLVAIILLVISAKAQERGQYVLGTNGLNAGVQPAPGFTYTNLFTWFSADRLKGIHGEAIPLPANSSTEVYVDQNFFYYVTKHKILGANYGFGAELPIVNQPLVGPLLTPLGKVPGGSGVGDVYFEPISLGWHLKHADFKLTYGFVAPTGRFTPGVADNAGSGYWGSQFQAAATFYFDKAKTWQVSIYNNYEIHSGKRSTSVTPGDTENLEWGLGKTFHLKSDASRLLQFGVVGYNQWQTTSDGGPSFNPGFHYQVHAIGPEVGFSMPTKKLSFLVRYLPEFGAVKRSEGHTLVGSVAYTF